jgi:hypothetical protein
MKNPAMGNNRMTKIPNHYKAKKTATKFRRRKNRQRNREKIEKKRPKTTGSFTFLIRYGLDNKNTDNTLWDYFLNFSIIFLNKMDGEMLEKKNHNYTYRSSSGVFGNSSKGD